MKQCLLFYSFLSTHKLTTHIQLDFTETYDIFLGAVGVGGWVLLLFVILLNFATKNITDLRSGNPLEVTRACSMRMLLPVNSCFNFYYTHFEITGDPCNLIGSQQCNLFPNRAIFLL